MCDFIESASDSFEDHEIMDAAEKSHMLIYSVQRASTLKLNLPILKSRQLSSSSLSLISLLFLN